MSSLNQELSQKQFQERAAEIFKKDPSEQERIPEEKEREIALRKIGLLVSGTGLA